jgi:hypothetical protein
MIKLLYIVAASFLVSTSATVASQPLVQDKISIVVDNLDPHNVKISGVWNRSSHTKGFVGKNYLTDNNKAKQHKQVKFSPDILESGNYNIYLHWTSGRNRAKKIPVEIAHAKGKSIVYVDQTKNGGKWILVGRYKLTSGNKNSVTIMTKGTKGFVIADAVKFEALFTTKMVGKAVGKVGRVKARDSATSRLKNKLNILDLFKLDYRIEKSIDFSQNSWKVKPGDNKSWKDVNLNDADWASIKVGESLFLQGYHTREFYWYRVKFNIPDDWQNSNLLLLDVGTISFYDQVFINGKAVGTYGKHPPEKPIKGSSFTRRRYLVNPKDIKFDRENLLAIKIYPGSWGGLYAGPYMISKIADTVIDFQINSAGKEAVNHNFTDAEHLNQFDSLPIKIAPKFLGLVNNNKSFIFTVKVTDKNRQVVFNAQKQGQLKYLAWTVLPAITINKLLDGEYNALLTITKSQKTVWQQTVKFSYSSTPQKIKIKVNPELAGRAVRAKAQNDISQDSLGHFGARLPNEKLMLTNDLGRFDTRGALTYVSTIFQNNPDILIYQNNVCATPKKPFRTMKCAPIAGGVYDGFNDLWSFGSISVGDNYQLKSIKVKKADWSSRQYNFAYNKNCNMEFIISTLSPAYLVDTTASALQVFKGLADWGLGQPGKMAFATKSGIKIVDADVGLSGRDMTENWVLVWFNGSKNWQNFDVPWLFVLQHRPETVKTEQDALVFNYKKPKGAGTVLGMPLSGVKLISLHKTDSWKKVLPKTVVAKCRLFSKALLEFPLFVKRTFETDFVNNLLTVKDKFRYRKTVDDWGTQGMKIAPHSPTLMLSAASGNNIDITFDRQVTDPAITTLHGPYCFTVGDTYTFQVKNLLNYINEEQQYSNMPLNSQRYQTAVDKLNIALEAAFVKYKFDQHPWKLAYKRKQDFLASHINYEDKFSDLVLCLPYMKEPLKSKYLKALKQEVTGSMLYTGYPTAAMKKNFTQHLDKIQVTEVTEQNNNLKMMLATRNAYYGIDILYWMSLRLYALWQHSYYLDGSQDIKNSWPMIKKFFNTFPHSHDWAIGICWDSYSGTRVGNGLQESTAIYAGMVAMARMAKSMGDEELYSYASYLAVMQLIGCNAAVTGFKYVRAQRPWCFAHRNSVPLAYTEKDLKMKYIEFNEFGGFSQNLILLRSTPYQIHSYILSAFPESMRPYYQIWQNENRYNISVYLKSVYDPLTLMHYLHLQQPNSSEIDAYYKRKLVRKNLFKVIKRELAILQSFGKKNWKPIMF